MTRTGVAAACVLFASVGMASRNRVIQTGGGKATEINLVDRLPEPTKSRFQMLGLTGMHHVPDGLHLEFRNLIKQGQNELVIPGVWLNEKRKNGYTKVETRHNGQKGGEDVRELRFVQAAGSKKGMDLDGFVRVLKSTIQLGKLAKFDNDTTAWEFRNVLLKTFGDIYPAGK